MPKFKAAKTDELYGTYKDFNEKQVEYLKFLTNPENKLVGYTEVQIADILGVDIRTLYNYRKDAKFREAINKETFLKSSDDLPDQWTDLTSMSLARGKYKDVSAASQLQAKKLWWQITGFVDEAKAKNIETQKEVRTSFEKRLLENDKQYKRDTMEVTE